LEFLEDTQPLPALLPAERHGRARVRSLCSMLAADTHPLITPRVKKYLTQEAGFDEAAWRRWQTQWFGVGMAAVEQRLASEPQTGLFCHGDVPTMADICLASVVAVMRVFKIEVPDIPTIDRIVARCSTLDAFAKAEPGRQVGAPR
jgi:maleylacetoacetate isomerase